MKYKNLLLYLSLVFIISNFTFGQNFSLKGKITAENGEALVGANVILTPGNYGAAADLDGNYKIDGIPSGTYSGKVSFIGYKTSSFQTTINSDKVLNFALQSSYFESKEVVVEVNRAKNRETPVAFSNIESKQIEQKIHGQDAPLLVKGTPGVYTYSTDGVGNGEAQLLVRGFSQNYVQVLINGIPTNDPESNAVYWSNWGSVSANASSIQIQRGAGSSLYGAGSFGGSFNIVTEDAPAKPYYAVNLSLGSPNNTMYGVRLNTGLQMNSFSAAFNFDKKDAEGSRFSGRYEGINYYLSFSYFPIEKHSLKFVLHGAPQKHGYSFSQSASYFKFFGYDANPANFLPKALVSTLPSNVDAQGNTTFANYNLLDNSRELVDNKFVNLAHNFFHKPQVELHYHFDINEESSLKATMFYSVGRGGGSSMNSTGSLYGLKAGSVTGTDTLFTNNRYASYYGIDGYLDDTSSFSAANIYLKNAYQRISYSLHQQVGIIASYNQKVGDMLNLTFGGELRSWSADHPGHFTNLFGKKSLTAQTYGFTDTLGLVKSFNRTVYEGDLDGPTSDWGFPSGWKLADSKDPQFRTQYRNYKGETPQYTIFAQGNWKHEDLNIMGSLQYVWYKYKLTEYMPSENAVGRQLKASERTALGLIDSSYEGPRNGKFYMMNPDKKNWYEFELVNAERSRGFIQPKVGFNYNMTKNLNMFANFAHVERFVDLGIYYNQGRVYPEAEDEKSNQFEFGTGWVSESFNAKVNTYYMLWENKSARIQDVTKSGQPGYDRNGFRTELVGTSRNIGLEFEFAADLNKFLPIKGFGLRGSITMMDNRWTKVLDSVMVDKKNLGQLQEDINMNGVLDPGEDVNGNNALNDNRRVFNTSALNIDGKKDVVYFAELADKHVASGPQLMGSIGLTFDYEEFFAAVDMNYYAKNYLLDGDSYMQVDGEWTNTGIATGFLAPYDTKQVFTSKYDNKFPGVAIFEVSAGYNINYWLLKGFVSIQVGNIFNTKYFAAADRFGIIPGALRSFRFNVGLGI